MTRLCRNAACERAARGDSLNPDVLHAYCDSCERALMATGSLPDLRAVPRWLRRDNSRDFTWKGAA